MKPVWKILIAIATAAAVAIVVLLSLRKGKADGERIDFSKVPMQTVDDMFAVQTKNGVVVMRIEADKMLRYETDTTTMELFPDGFSVSGTAATAQQSGPDRNVRWKASITSGGSPKEAAKISRSSGISSEIQPRTVQVAITSFFPYFFLTHQSHRKCRRCR